MHSKLLKFSSNAVGGVGIKIPIRISTTRGTCHSCESVVGDVLFIKSVPIDIGNMTHFQVHFTLGMLGVAVWIRWHIGVMSVGVVGEAPTRRTRGGAASRAMTTVVATRNIVVATMRPWSTPAP
jgi:hypothetical protein